MSENKKSKLGGFNARATCEEKARKQRWRKSEK